MTTDLSPSGRQACGIYCHALEAPLRLILIHHQRRRRHLLPVGISIQHLYERRRPLTKGRPNKRARPARKDVEGHSALLEAEDKRHEPKKRLSKKPRASTGRLPPSSEDAPTSPNLLPTEERAADEAAEEVTDLAAEDVVGPAEVVPEQGAEAAEIALDYQPEVIQNYWQIPPVTIPPPVLIRADAVVSVGTAAKPEKTQERKCQMRPAPDMPDYSMRKTEDTGMTVNQILKSEKGPRRRRLPRTSSAEEMQGKDNMDRKDVTESLISIVDFLERYTLLEGHDLERARVVSCGRCLKAQI